MHSKRVNRYKEKPFSVTSVFYIERVNGCMFPLPYPRHYFVCLITLFPGGIVPNKQKQENVSNSWTSYEIKIEIVRKKIVTIF